MSAARIILFLIIGAVAWFIAAQFIRIFGPELFSGGWPNAATLAGAALVSPVLNWAVAKGTGTPLADMIVPMVLMVIVALMLDGLAITYAPALYGGEGITLAHGAAFLLWGVGCLLLSALVMARR